MIGAARQAGIRAGFFRRRRNRRIEYARPSLAVLAAEGLSVVARKLVTAGKVLAALAFLAGAAWGGQRAVRGVIASPRFALREIRVAATTHVQEQDVVALAAVHDGDKLLAVDTDAVAARVATHPWVAQARVRRELPSALVIEVVEREAPAAALLGALYLLDGRGHPFKRATLEEADGLPVLTGISREQYTAHRDATEAAYREALALLDAYGVGSAGAAGQADARPAGAPKRPPLSEIHIDPRYGFSLVLFDGGGEIRLGRAAAAAGAIGAAGAAGWTAKLARFDRILLALGPRGASALRAVHLDGTTQPRERDQTQDRVTIRLDGPAPDAAPAPPATTPAAAASKKFRPAPKRGED